MYYYLSEEIYTASGINQHNWLSKSRYARSIHKKAQSQFFGELETLINKLSIDMLDEQEMEQQYEDCKRILENIIKFRKVEYDLLNRWTSPNHQPNLSNNNGHVYWINKMEKILEILNKLQNNGTINVENINNTELTCLQNFAKKMDTSEDR